MVNLPIDVWFSSSFPFVFSSFPQREANWFSSLSMQLPKIWILSHSWIWEERTRWWGPSSLRKLVQKGCGTSSSVLLACPILFRPTWMIYSLQASSGNMTVTFVGNLERFSSIIVFARDGVKWVRLAFLSSRRVPDNSFFSIDMPFEEVRGPEYCRFDILDLPLSFTPALSSQHDSKLRSSLSSSRYLISRFTRNKVLRTTTRMRSVSQLQFVQFSIRVSWPLFFPLWTGYHFKAEAQDVNNKVIAYQEVVESAKGKKLTAAAQKVLDVYLDERKALVKTAFEVSSIYYCTLFIGRLTGQLRTIQDGKKLAIWERSSAADRQAQDAAARHARTAAYVLCSVLSHLSPITHASIRLSRIKAKLVELGYDDRE